MTQAGGHSPWPLPTSSSRSAGAGSAWACDGDRRRPGGDYPGTYPGDDELVDHHDIVGRHRRRPRPARPAGQRPARPRGAVLELGAPGSRASPYPPAGSRS